jgi:hypothetical protein
VRRAHWTLNQEKVIYLIYFDMLYSQVPWLLYRYIILISPWVSSQFPPSATFAWHGWPLHRAWCPSGPSSRPRPRPACPDHVGQSSCRKLFLIGDIPIPLKNDGVRQMIKIIPTIGENNLK